MTLEEKAVFPCFLNVNSEAMFIIIGLEKVLHKQEMEKCKLKSIRILNVGRNISRYERNNNRSINDRKGFSIS